MTTQHPDIVSFLFASYPDSDVRQAHADKTRRQEERRNRLKLAKDNQYKHRFTTAKWKQQSAAEVDGLIVRHDLHRRCGPLMGAADSFSVRDIRAIARNFKFPGPRRNRKSRRLKMRLQARAAVRRRKIEAGKQLLAEVS